MTAKPLLGKTHFKQEISRIRQAAAVQRRCLRRIVDERPSQGVLAMLIAQTALQVSEIEAASQYLVEIAENTERKLNKLKGKDT